MWFFIAFCPLLAMLIMMAFIFRLTGRDKRRAKVIKEYETVYGKQHYYLDDNCAIKNVQASDILFSKELKGKVIYHGKDVDFLKEGVVELNQTEQTQ
jgi:hypothetical protein